jgi:hypothetical protein
LTVHVLVGHRQQLLPQIGGGALRALKPGLYGFAAAFPRLEVLPEPLVTGFESRAFLQKQRVFGTQCLELLRRPLLGGLPLVLDLLQRLGIALVRPDTPIEQQTGD